MSHHPDIFGNHRHCDSGDKFLICHMTLPDQVFKGLSEFMSGFLLCLVAIGQVQEEIPSI